MNTNPFQASAVLFDEQDNIQQTIDKNLAAIERSKQKPLGYIAVEKIHSAIVAALKVRDIKLEAIPARAKVREDNGRVEWFTPKLEGLNRIYVDVTEDYERSSRFRSHPTGRYSVVIGDYGDKKRFPQRKDGSHNYEAIAAEIHVRIDREKRLAQERNVRNENEELSKKLCAELTGEPYSNPYPLRLGYSANQDKPINAKFDVNLPYDEAKRLYEVLKREGFIK